MELTADTTKRRKRKSTSVDEYETKTNIVKSSDSNDDSSIIPLIPSNFRVPSLHPDANVSTDNNNQLVLSVTCGYFSAKLHMDKFYCPGIHQLCIEYNGQFISPKQLTIIAGKDKQKDWKAAVKLNQQPMR